VTNDSAPSYIHTGHERVLGNLWAAVEVLAHNSLAAAGDVRCTLQHVGPGFGLDEGLLSFSLPRFLVCMENPYKRNK
jgi:hypothetical protein